MTSYLPPWATIKHDRSAPMGAISPVNLRPPVQCDKTTPMTLLSSHPPSIVGRIYYHCILHTPITLQMGSTRKSQMQLAVLVTSMIHPVTSLLLKITSQATADDVVYFTYYLVLTYIYFPASSFLDLLHTVTKIIPLFHSCQP